MYIYEYIYIYIYVYKPTLCKLYIYIHIYIDPYIPSKAAKYGGSPPADPGPGPAAGPLHRGRELSEPEAVASSTHHFQMVDVYLYIYIYI